MSISTQAKPKNTPKLRFPEFSGEWEEKLLSELFDKKSQKNTGSRINNVLTNSATQGVVNQRDYFEKDIANQGNLTNYFVVDKDDFVYNPRISRFAPVGPLKRNHNEKGVMSPLYTVLVPRKGDPDFLEEYFQTTKWHRYMYKIANYGARHDRMSILQDDFLKMPIPSPELEEQKKISNFLTDVNQWINNLKKQKKELEKYKKGMMQKIFSQEIRFKDDNGKDFPEWEEKKFSELFCTVSTKEYQVKNSEILKDGKYIVVDQGQDLVAGYSNDSNRLLKESPVIMFGDHTTVLKYIDFDFIPGADGTKILKQKVDEGNLKFLFYALSVNAIRAEGYKRHFSILKRVRIQVPLLSEQQKITDFLTNLDNLIQSKQQKISQAENWKKGLMQRMFV